MATETRAQPTAASETAGNGVRPAESFEVLNPADHW